MACPILPYIALSWHTLHYPTLPRITPHYPTQPCNTLHYYPALPYTHYTLPDDADMQTFWTCRQDPNCYGRDPVLHSAPRVLR